MSIRADRRRCIWGAVQTDEKIEPGAPGGRLYGSPGGKIHAYIRCARDHCDPDTASPTVIRLISPPNEGPGGDSPPVCRLQTWAQRVSIRAVRRRSIWGAFQTDEKVEPGAPGGRLYGSPGGKIRAYIGRARDHRDPDTASPTVIRLISPPNE